MHLKIFILHLAAAIPLGSAYRILGDGVNCRSGPSTSYGVIRTYNTNDDVTLTCQIHGENINGLTLWDKTSDGCYVSDYYVETGTPNMVAPACNDGGGGVSPVEGPITRSEIMSRANDWISQHVPYSMEAYYPDIDGARYRTDCSGFVSMALHLSTPGRSTVTLPDVARAISWGELRQGDFVGTLGPGTGGAGGHVTLFDSWANIDQTRYHTLECKGDAGCVRYERNINWQTDAGFTAKPYRYTRVTD